MERKIGEIFQDGEVTLKVECNNHCSGCFYDNDECDNDIEVNGFCSKIRREDKTSIIFKKQQ